jgi:hypothetical protein
MARYLINKQGYIYPYTQALAKRADMTEYNGELKDAKEAGAAMVVEANDPGVVVEEDSPEETVPEAQAVSDDLDTDAKIRVAITRLDRDDPEHFTQNGSPRVAAVEALIGEDVTQEQVQSVWDEMNA